MQNDAGDEPIERPKPVYTLSDDVKQQVENFYRYDDISCQAPGRKDVVSVKKNGSRAKYQTRYLTYQLTRYLLFSKKNIRKLKLARASLPVFALQMCY